jgi:phosphatidylglycerophosphate synthase
MGIETACVLALLSGLPLVVAAYYVRVLSRGRPRYSRIESQGGGRFVSKRMMEIAYWALTPVSRLAVRRNVSPDTISWSSAALGLAAGTAVALGKLGLATLALLVSASLDAVDGMVARSQGRASESGYVLDSHLDRLVEFFFLAGLAFHFRQSAPLLLLTLAALLGSYMVSYATLMARFKAVAIPPGTVPMRRAERLSFLLAGSALSTAFGHPLPIVCALLVVAVFANAAAHSLLLKMMAELRARGHDAGVKSAHEHVENVVMIQVNGREAHEQAERRSQHH